jgi:hypothetical protein
LNQASSLSLTVTQEHLFWLHVLEDHARFLLDRLAPHEQEWIGEADRFAAGFASLRGKLPVLPEPSLPYSQEWISFAKEAHRRAAGYYKLEGRLQALLLRKHIQLDLPPSFLNSTLNENQEYLRLLRYYVQGAEAPPLPLWDLMELWLGDQLGHANLLHDLADLTDVMKAEAIRTAEDLRTHLIRNKAIHGYLRFTPPGFDEQLEAAAEAADCVTRFCRQLRDHTDRLNAKAAVSPFIDRFLKHQLVESAYFLQKLSDWLPGRPLLQEAAFLFTAWEEWNQAPLRPDDG